MRAKLDELQRALTGAVREHHRFLLAQLLRHSHFLAEEIALVEERIEAELAGLPAFAFVGAAVVHDTGRGPAWGNRYSGRDRGRHEPLWQSGEAGRLGGNGTE